MLRLRELFKYVEAPEPESPAEQPRDRFQRFKHPDPNPHVVITGPEAERLLARMRPRSRRSSDAITEYDVHRW